MARRTGKIEGRRFRRLKFLRASFSVRDATIVARRFEPPILREKLMACFDRSDRPGALFLSENQATSSEREQQFESSFLRRGVLCELTFGDFEEVLAALVGRG
jgi:hypothetical protein